MEALSLAPRKLSGGDLLIALGLSVIAHVVIVFFALVLPQLMPHQTGRISFYTVDLVTMDELKGPVAPPVKGGKTSGVKSQNTKSSSRKSSDGQKALSSPLVPVKRLQFDDSPRKSATGLKKMETSDLPKLESQVDRPKSLEKDLENLTKKPKTATPPRTKDDAPEEASSSAEKSSKNPGGTDQPAESSKTNTSGMPQGSANGSAQASAGGAQVGLARRLYYTEVWNAIRSKWALPDFLKDKSLEAVLVVTVRRDGKILDVNFEKRSGNALFDESAERAVKKADPLPPFPAIYSPPKEQIGVRFRPEDL